MPSRWSVTADRDFYLSIIDVCVSKSIPWDVVVDAMKVKGYDFSREACRQHFQAGKKHAKEERASGVSATSSPVKTPSKLSNKASSKTTAGRKRKNGTSLMAAAVQDQVCAEVSSEDDQHESKKLKFDDVSPKTELGAELNLETLFDSGTEAEETI